VDKTKVFSVTALFLCFCSISNGFNLIYVDVNGPNDPGTGRFEDPYRRIQSAIDDAKDGDIIEIRPGLYTGAGNYDLDPNGAAITICSTDPNDSNVTASTIIDANKAGRGFYIHSGEDANFVVAGLTLRNCATNVSGGGIYCYDSSPTITMCVIINNEAEGSGGGIYCSKSKAAIINCIIAGNHASFGGGIRCSLGSDIEVANCTIVKNSTSPEWGGDGIYCSSSSSPNIVNSIIRSNGSEQIYAGDGSPIITYSNIEDGWAGTGNIDTDPCFASFDPNGEPNMWDFHLQSAYGRWDGNSFGIDFNKDGVVNLFDFAKLANVWFEESTKLPEDLNNDNTVDLADLQIFAEYFLTTGYKSQWIFDAMTSPCVDAGDPNSDWSDEAWPNGKRINMGAYGGTYEASKNGNAADFNVDGTVHFADFGQFAKEWKLEQKCIEDLNGNGVVEYADLDMFANNWLWQKE